MSALWAVVPVKELALAKQRLGPRLAPALRRALMLAMLEDVLAALTKAPALTGIAVVTADPDAASLAARFGTEVWNEEARAGHSEAVSAAARRLAREGCSMLTVPADIPLVTADDIAQLAAAAATVPAFVIAPSRDRRGSNAVLCAPADCVPLRFGDGSFLAHLAAAGGRGIAPAILELPRVALDIDTGDDLDLFVAQRSDTRAQAALDRVRL